MLSNIQSLRAIAAFLVFLTHFELVRYRFPYFPGFNAHRGIFGVDLFFVISGFIMVYITRENWGRIGSFSLGRALRIYPLWWVCLLISAPETFPYLLGKSDAYTSYYVSSFFLLPALSNGNLYPPLVQGWTLSYELMFYALFALVMLTPRRYVALKVLAALVAVYLFGQCASNATARQFLANPVYFEFFFGAVIGELFVSQRLRIWHLAPIAAAAAIMAVAAAHWRLNDGGPWRTLYYGLPAALIVTIALLLERVHIKSPRPLVWMGSASYSLYLIHGIVFDKIGPWLSLTPTWLILPITLVAVVSASFILYFIVERPMQKFTRFTTRRMTSVPRRLNVVFEPPSSGSTK